MMPPPTNALLPAGPVWFDVFAAEPENRIAREERGGGKTSVVGSPM
jgi:hypothetical protein